MIKKTMPTIFLVLMLTLLGGCANKNGKISRFDIPAQGILQDTRTKQMWQVEKSKRIKSFAEAEAFAAQLSLGGYDDWRLPTIYELYDLNYLFDLHRNGNITLDREGNYWSGEKDGDGMIGAWAISDQCDPNRLYEPGKVGYVRAVRP